MNIRRPCYHLGLFLLCTLCISIHSGLIFLLLEKFFIDFLFCFVLNEPKLKYVRLCWVLLCCTLNDVLPSMLDCQQRTILFFNVTFGNFFISKLNKRKQFPAELHSSLKHTFFVILPINQFKKRTFFYMIVNKF